MHGPTAAVCDQAGVAKANIAELFDKCNCLVIFMQNICYKLFELHKKIKAFQDKFDIKRGVIKTMAMIHTVNVQRVGPVRYHGHFSLSWCTIAVCSDTIMPHHAAL